MPGCARGGDRAHSAAISPQHELTLSTLTTLHRRFCRPVLVYELADELDVLVTGDALPPPVDLVLDDLARAGLSAPVGAGWAPLGSG